MGQEAEAAARKRAFEGYQVTMALMRQARDRAAFMHCLPAHRNEEVTTDVFESPMSVVFDQAENRLHSQKALLLTLMTQLQRRVNHSAVYGFSVDAALRS